ncbi:MAG: thiamine-phosphate kinase [Alphaproteobacteria bacterium]|nr:thiamine-phosphate kinase [Alphaproteobacteria bacterium]
MDEFAAIARYLAPLAAAEPGALGLTDDAALLDPPPGRSLVLTKDVMAAGVHFLRDDAAALVARKLLRVNLSDLAAMGAAPWAYLLGLTLPRPFDEAWLADFAAGLAADQAAFGITLVGGDTTAHDGPMVLSLTALGTVAVGRALRRGTARAGDTVWVSGTLGDGALGLRALRGELAALAETDRTFLAGRYHLPEPRLTLGAGLVGLASAAIDVSDGLLADLGHIRETSGLGAEVHVDRVPLSAAARAAIAHDPALMADVLGGGDDYELLFTAPGAATDAILALGARTGVGVTPIGRMVAGQGINLLDAAGRPIPPPTRAGWAHF